jgi:hypothetical protein
MSGGASRDKRNLARSARETAETRHPLRGTRAAFTFVNIVSTNVNVLMIKWIIDFETDRTFAAVNIVYAPSRLFTDGGNYLFDNQTR